MEQEIWKDVLPFVGVYQISNFGRLRSFKKDPNGKILSLKNKDGWYLSVVLIKGKTRISVKVHDLVAAYFIGEKPAGFQVHHEDGNKQNNYWLNLSYISKKEHCRITIKNNPNMLSGMINYNTQVKPKMIYQYDLEGNFIKCFSNSIEAEAATGVCYRNILQVASKTEYKPGLTRKQAGGFIWKFE